MCRRELGQTMQLGLSVEGNQPLWWVSGLAHGLDKEEMGRRSRESGSACPPHHTLDQKLEEDDPTSTKPTITNIRPLW